MNSLIENKLKCIIDIEKILHLTHNFYSENQNIEMPFISYQTDKIFFKFDNTQY